MAEEEEGDSTSRSTLSPVSKKKTNPPNGVQKSRGMTHSRGGVAATTGAGAGGITGAGTGGGCCTTCGGGLYQEAKL